MCIFIVYKPKSYTFSHWRNFPLELYVAQGLMTEVILNMNYVKYAYLLHILTFWRVIMGMEESVPTGTAVADTNFGYTLSLIGGKYKMTILFWLADKGVMRHNQLKRAIGTISFKTLSLMLKELEKDALIIRKEYPQVPPKVEYSLSERGESIIPLLNAMCSWGEQHRPPRG